MICFLQENFTIVLNQNELTIIEKQENIEYCLKEILSFMLNPPEILKKKKIVSNVL